MSRQSKLVNRTRRGNYSIFFALMVPVMFGFAALGLDVSYIRLSEQQLQHAADAASHAAYVVYRGSNDTALARNAAEEIINRNRVGNGHGKLGPVTFGVWEDGNFQAHPTTINAAHVEVTRAGDNALDLFFGPFMGVNQRSIQGEAITAGRTRQIMIVQDITGSFTADIHEARLANLAFLDYLKDHPVPDDQIGMAVFVGASPLPVWSPMEYVESHYAPLRQKWETLDICNCLWVDYGCTRGNCSPTRTCDGTYAGYNHAPWMPDCFDPKRYTSQGPGIEAAIEELLDKGDPTAFQAIIVVSDGLPLGADGETKEEREQMAVDAVDRAWDQHGIHVWTVTFENSSSDGFGFLSDLARGQGKGYNTKTASDLTNIMLEIASSIPVVLVK